MNPTAYFITTALIIITIHELGHHAAFKHYKYKPKIKFHPLILGVSVGNEHIKDLTPYQKIDIHLAGVLTGLIPVILFYGTNKIAHLAYTGISTIDLLAIITLPIIYKKNMRTPIWVSDINQARKTISETLKWRKQYTNTQQKKTSSQNKNTTNTNSTPEDGVETNKS